MTFKAISLIHFDTLSLIYLITSKIYYFYFSLKTFSECEKRKRAVKTKVATRGEYLIAVTSSCGLLISK